MPHSPFFFWLTSAWPYFSGNPIGKGRRKCTRNLRVFSWNRSFSKADISRAGKIRASLPQVGKDCDTFYRQSFLDPVSGYSDIETDLDSIASKAGVKNTGFGFKQKDVKDRGVTQITINTTVEAPYPAVIAFIDGLERSKYFYLVDEVEMTSGENATIRLQLGLHTFFQDGLICPGAFKSTC